MIHQGKARYPVREAIIHTAATPANWWKGKTVEQMRDEIDRWHKGNGWKGIGYHRVIAPDGSMAIGRSLYEIGAHVAGRNRGTIGICLVPVAWVDRMGHFDDWYTPQQKTTLRAYLRELAGMTEIQIISGHNQYAAKLCPGFHVQDTGWLDVQAINSGVRVTPPPRPDDAAQWPSESLPGPSLHDRIRNLLRGIASAWN